MTVRAVGDEGATEGRSMIGRVAAILHAFEAGEVSVGISELARRSGLPKSSAARIIGELVDHRLLERSDGGVRLGIRMFEFGEAVQRRHLLRQVALPYMAELRASLNLTVHLTVLEATEVVYLEILRAREAPPLATRVGGRLPAYSTSAGKALLAWSPESVVAAALDGPLQPLSPRTITSAERIRRELAEVRDTGLAFDHEESRSGISAVATALLDGRGAPLLAISVAGRSETVASERVARKMRATGVALSRSLRTRPTLTAKLAS